MNRKGKKRIGSVWIAVVFGLTWLNGLPICAQEEPSFVVHVYAFYMPLKELKLYFEDGLTRTEIDQLQSVQNKQTGLFPKRKPIELQGEQSVSIESSLIQPLWQDMKEKVVVFLFEITRPKELCEADLVIQQKSYGISDKEETEVRVREKNKSISTRSLRYRILDYRNAALLKRKQFVYEFNVSIGPVEKKGKVTLNLPME